MKMIKRTLIILIIATTIFTVVKCNRIEDEDNIKQEQGEDNKDEQDKEEKEEENKDNQDKEKQDKDDEPKEENQDDKEKEEIKIQLNLDKIINK